ncbi:hypothetical protein LJB87_00065 [Alistipes sp. OttesenSCG-928-L06]|nr:hypothetical protein [Alistipes sp. OttesenSCG-928-L06]
MKENKLNNVPKMLAVVVALLTGLSLFGGFSVGGWDSKPVRLYADLTKGLDETGDDFDDSHLWAQIELPEPAVSPEPALPEPDAPTSPGETQPETPAAAQMNTVPIEDFSENKDALTAFFTALGQVDELDRPVRVAFLGDSFVEGDILTSDVREYLQERFGGRGVGFVPLAPIDRWRNTMNVEHDGWKIRNSLYGDQKAKYLFNGQCFAPSDGEAYVKVQATDQREHAKAFNTATLLYSADSAATLHYKLGGAEEREAALRDGGTLQLFEMSRQNMRSATFRIEANEDFTGYGLFLNDATGVCVDNYSLRSSSGMQLLRVGPALLTRMNRLVPYDLVVLQYGMNVMEAERRDYNAYVDQMVRVVNRIREAMPGVSILVFGVGDRNFKNDDGEMVTKVGVVNLVDAQRRIAQETGVAFWNTYLAMGGRNSMGAFVNQTPALANKDYTHINYHGGRRLGLAFGEALTQAQSRY